MKAKTSPLAIGISVARRLTGLSAAQLAVRAGVHPNVIRRLERGKTMPRAQELHRIGQALKAAQVGGPSDLDA